MKLSILVPQCKEKFETIRPLLDSIQIQQNVNFADIEVIILNDGSDVILDGKEFEKYGFKIEYRIRKQNKGVSYTRNELLTYANGEYVMYCDADDMFFNVMGLFLIMQEIDKGFDILASAFVEEMFTNNKTAYIIRPDNRVFVHGKVLRKQYLIDKKIRWNNKLKIHEDFYYFAQCFCLTERIRYCPEPFYLWRYRKDSVCRNDKEFLYKTYVKCIDSHEALIKELLKKKAKEPAQYYCSKFIYSFFNMMRTEEWKNKYREQTIKRFGEYYKTFKDLFNSAEDRESLIKEFKIDTKLFKEFIKKITK